MIFRISTHLSTKKNQFFFCEEENNIDNFLGTIESDQEIEEVYTDFNLFNEKLLSLGINLEEIETKEILFQALKNEKIAEAKQKREQRLAQDIFVKNIDNEPFWTKSTPRENFFQAAFSMQNDEIRKWGCKDSKGNIVFLNLTKKEIFELSQHLDQRNNQVHNACDESRIALNQITSLKEIANFEIF